MQKSDFLKIGDSIKTLGWVWKVLTIKWDLISILLEWKIIEKSLSDLDNIDSILTWKLLWKKAWWNLLMIELQAWETITKFVWDCEIKWDQVVCGWPKFDSRNKIDVGSTMSYLHQNKSEYWCNLRIKYHGQNSIEMKWVLQQNNIELRWYPINFNIKWESTSLIFINPENRELLIKCIEIADDLGYWLQAIDKSKDQITGFIDFYWSWNWWEKEMYQIQNIDNAIRILKDNKDFRSQFDRSLEKYGFASSINFYQSVIDKVNLLNQDRENKIPLWISEVIWLNDSVVRYMNQEEWSIQLLVAFLEKNWVEKSSVSYLIGCLQWPYTLFFDTYTHTSIYNISWKYFPNKDNKRSYLMNKIDAESTSLFLKDIKEYYDSIWFPILVTTDTSGYYSIFNYMLTQIDNRIDEGNFDITEVQLNEILEVFKWYWVDENNNYVWSKEHWVKSINKIRVRNWVDELLLEIR